MRRIANTFLGSDKLPAVDSNSHSLEQDCSPKPQYLGGSIGMHNPPPKAVSTGDRAEFEATKCRSEDHHRSTTPSIRAYPASSPAYLVEVCIKLTRSSCISVLSIRATLQCNGATELRIAPKSYTTTTNKLGAMQFTHGRGLTRSRWQFCSRR